MCAVTSLLLFLGFFPSVQLYEKVCRFSGFASGFCFYFFPPPRCTIETSAGLLSE